MPENDLRDDALGPRSDSLDHLRDEGLLERMPLDERDRGVVVTDRGRDLVEMHLRDRDDARRDPYGDRVNRRELTHDASVYDAYRHAADELRERGADVSDVALERELKREYLFNNGRHMLRHTFCSHLAMPGAPARAIQELAGHQNLTTTRRYMHLSPAALDGAIRLLERPACVTFRGDILETVSTPRPHRQRHAINASPRGRKRRR